MWKEYNAKENAMMMIKMVMMMMMIRMMMTETKWEKICEAKRICICVFFFH